ncbi:DNA processing protein DprA [Erwinia typographi]|uniref:DNA processing protein DprA n=1 Tax=Erwinia typographi TaxID=371042 RepID=A0A0A3YL41_9GAMM|nr:DNA-protecting protein DprA [Erwinia typographi]KGT86234.1 DNA processing protein DprA [Erwinia typographi]
MTPTEIWLRLSGVKGMRNRQRLRAAAFLRLNERVSKEDLIEAGLSEEQGKAFLNDDPAMIENTLVWLTHPQHHLLTCDSPQYPERLRNIASSPPLLFIAGNPAVLLTPQVAIVGSRRCSHYGRNWGSFFAQKLALSDITITSGLAVGIDSIAHRAALEVGGKTLAVLGSGLNHLYPRQHSSLAREIIDSGGAVISEYPLSTRPAAHHFPRRNRIISGLSLGVLVVEATLKSGSLITARLALEQNRDVYALPGAIGNSGSEGPHWLIQQGALLTAHPNTILEQLQSDLKWLPDIPNSIIYSHQEGNTPLPFADVLANVGDEVTPVDVVAERAGQPVPAIVAKLLELELAGWIAAVPGGYVRLRRASHVRRTNVLI